MQTVRLVYASRLTDKCDADQLRGIIESSRKNNRERGITGLLCHSDESFLHCLEGPRDAVNRLYRNIVDDDRNSECTILSYGEIDEREFEDWAMGVATVRDFDPFVLSADAAWALLRGLVKWHRRSPSRAVAAGA